MTDSELAAWEVLRDRRFHGLRFKRQRPFGPFVVDFYCARLKLVIEIDGGVHDEPSQAAYDVDRQRALEARGLRVIRVRAEDVERDAHAALDDSLPQPPPGDGSGPGSNRSRQWFEVPGVSRSRPPPVTGRGVGGRARAARRT